jgi:hypothetical protein
VLAEAAVASRSANRYLPSTASSSIAATMAPVTAREKRARSFGVSQVNAPTNAGFGVASDDVVESSSAMAPSIFAAVRVACNTTASDRQ